jgi:hypothetical protein
MQLEKSMRKIGLGSTKQMRDDEVVPLICPTISA